MKNKYYWLMLVMIFLIGYLAYKEWGKNIAIIVWFAFLFIADGLMVMSNKLSDISWNLSTLRENLAKLENLYSDPSELPDFDRYINQTPSIYTIQETLLEIRLQLLGCSDSIETYYPELLNKLDTSQDTLSSIEKLLGMKESKQ